MADLRVLALLGTIFTHQHSILAAASANGARVTLVGTRDNPYEGKWDWEVGAPPDLNVVYLKPRRSWRAKEFSKWWYPDLSEALDALRPEIVHVLAEPWNPLVLHAIHVSRRSAAPPKVCIHGAANIYDHGMALKRTARRLLLRTTLRRVAGFASWNMEGVALAKSYGLASTKPTAVIPALVPDPATFTPLESAQRTRVRRDLRLPEREIIVSFIGRFEPEKGLVEFLHALRILGRSAPYFAVWGHGSDARRAKEVVANSPLRGEIRPPLSADNVAKALAASDILVVPSRTTSIVKEQFGRIVVEAMLTATPVVAYACGALPDVVGDAGLLVNEGDVKGLAHAIASLASDGARRAVIGGRGRERALARYHPDLLGAELVEFWRTVLAT